MSYGKRFAQISRGNLFQPYNMSKKNKDRKIGVWLVFTGYAYVVSKILLTYNKCRHQKTSLICGVLGQ